MSTAARIMETPPTARHSTGNLEVRPISDAVGADVIGLDLTDLRAAQFRVLRQAVLDHGVVRLRGYTIDDDRQVAIGRMFGAPVGTTVARAKKYDWSEKYPEMVVISNIKENGETLGVLENSELNWHTDLAFDEVPPSLSLLRALEVPEHGGDTGFANMYKGLEALPDSLRRRVEGLKLKHQKSHDAQGNPRVGFDHLDAGDVTALPGPVHPILRTHPDTGRQALYLGRRFGGYIMGLPVAESEALLDELWHYGTLPEHTWHQDWQVGDMVIWDNRCVMHRRDNFPAEERRRMHRIVIMGSKPY